MADVTLIGATAPVNASASTGTRTISFPLPAGTNRGIVVVFQVTKEFGGTTGSIADMSATFNAAAMVVKGVDFAGAATPGDNLVAGVAACAVPDASTGTLDFVLTLGGAGQRVVAMQLFCFADADTDGFLLATQYDSDTFTASPGALTGVTPAAVGDMTFAFQCFANTSIATFTPATYFNAGGGLGTLSSSPSGYAARGAAAFATGYTASQVATWTSGAIGVNAPLAGMVFSLPAAGSTPPPVVTSYNCDCVDEDTFEPRRTLEDLRTEFLTLTGYAAQVTNPPASATALANQLLKSSQRFLYYKYPALRTRRLFRWSMLEGVRFYELSENDEDPDCGFEFNPYKAIEWVGVRDLGGAWLPMIEGINPQFYTMVEQPGIPAYYEIRQCIEVLPAPQADGYELWIKGHFGLAAFEDDADVTTIDSEVILYWAVALRKKAQGSPDAAEYAGMAKTRLGDLTAGTHGGRRYVPGVIQLPPAAMPIFLPLNGSPP